MSYIKDAVKDKRISELLPIQRKLMSLRTEIIEAHFELYTNASDNDKSIDDMIVDIQDLLKDKLLEKALKDYCNGVQNGA